MIVWTLNASQPLIVEDSNEGLIKIVLENLLFFLAHGEGIFGPMNPFITGREWSDFASYR